MATTIQAPPYTARFCEACETWIYTANGPFAEGDRTKTIADAMHWEANHDAPEPGQVVFGFPYMRFNETTVTAVVE